jgi:Putative esterase
MNPLRLFLALLLLASTCLTTIAADAIPKIPRVLPPEGLEIQADVRSRLETRLAATRKSLEADRSPWLFPSDQIHPDIDIFLKAVDYALRHREFYVPKDFEKADWALNEADKRIAALEKRDVSLQRSTGLVVRGYRSVIDKSAQPFGLVIPENHDFEKPCPLYVWMHGRGDKNTDLHFLYERATRPGQIAPPGAIVLHVFGRHCVGYKAAGERDVHEAVAAVEARYKIDDNRKVLMGFSMGGAGAWQVGAHLASEWAAISPGAGFVETLRYQRLNPEKIPGYERTLWGLNDVPDYVRNLFNTNVIAYSGELDRQREAAMIMEEAYKAEGQMLTHLIGPGVEHKYEPNTLADLMKRLDAIVAKGRDPFPAEVHFQTRTLRYHRQAWVMATGLEAHWQDARVDARRAGDKITVQTQNVTRFRLMPLPPGPADDEQRLKASKIQYVIDGQTLLPREDGEGLWVGNRLAVFIKRDGRWQWYPLSEATSAARTLQKGPPCQGPIDDAFVEPFLVVTPTGKSKNPQFQTWVDFELSHFRDRWRAVMRGELPEKRDIDFGPADEKQEINLVFFGDPDSNSVMARMLENTPIRFQGGKWTFGEQSFEGNRFVPVLTFPRRFGGDSLPKYKYTVLNSGLTFREGHDRTNSQQNPKLPDWAIVDITQPPDAQTPGRIHDADFFDENWQLKRQPKAP